MLALTDLMALTPVDWVTVGSLVCHRVGKCSYVKRKRQKLEGLQKYINILIDLIRNIFKYCEADKLTGIYNYKLQIHLKA